MKKCKLPFLKSGGLNDVIEGFFSKKEEKNVPKSCSNESEVCLAYQQYSHTGFPRIPKISGKKLGLTEMADWKLQVCNLQN